MAEAVGTDGSKKPKWEETVRQEQQLYYEMLGDRDWDNYEKTELEYLERNVGHAMYGPPEEMPDVNKNGGTGYSSKKLEHIRKVCATIQEHSKCPSTEGKNGDVWVSIIFVCLNSEEGSVPIPVFRIPNCMPNKPSDSTSCSGKETSTDAKLKKKSTDICHQFIDSNCRVYKDWKHFLETNKLPKCTYCYPSGGVYNGNENDEVLVEFGTTPASRFTSRLCSALDTTGSVVMVGGMAVSVAAMFTTVAASVAAAATVGAVSTGVYGAGRSVAALVDRGKHRQSVGIHDTEARSCWLNMLGSSLGIASGQAVRVLSNMTQKGQVLCKAGRLMVTGLNFGSLAVNGLGLVNNFVALRERARQGELTRLEVFQFASSLLFFSMSAVNVKTADSIIRETQNGVIGDFEASLRSNRHRRAFRRVARETRGAEGESMHGNAKVIKGITHIDNKDDFFAGLVRVQKQLGKSGAKVSLTDAGLVDINGELHLHPMRFSQIDKVQRQVILDATKNLKKGAWSQARFDEEVHTICQEQKIVFESQRRDTAPSVDERIPDGQALTKQTNKLSEMKVNLDILTYQLKNFAKEHHNKIITIAINLAEMTGFKQTAEFFKIVQIIAQLTEQTVSEVEGKYQQDLLAAQNYLGANFDRKQFDDDYHIQGCREEHFVKAILTNYNTYAALSQLKTFLQTFFKKENKSSQNDSKQQSNQGGPQNKKDGSKATPVGTVNGSQQQNNSFKPERKDNVASGAGADKQMATLRLNLQFQIKVNEVDTLLYMLLKFTREHHSKIMSIAVSLTQMLGWKSTEKFLEVVKFLVNTVEKVIGQLEEEYQKKLRSVLDQLGASFDRKQFDNMYQIQGDREDHFRKVTLDQYSDEALLDLRNACERCLESREYASQNIDVASVEQKYASASKVAPSASNFCNEEVPMEINCLNSLETDSPQIENSSATCPMPIHEPLLSNCTSDDNDNIIYRTKRNFEIEGDLSSSEIYKIASDVTGLYLFEGNATLFCDGTVAFVSITDPHIEPVTVVVNSNSLSNTVTATIIM